MFLTTLHYSAEMFCCLALVFREWSVVCVASILNITLSFISLTNGNLTREVVSGQLCEC